MRDGGGSRCTGISANRDGIRSACLRCGGVERHHPVIVAAADSNGMRAGGLRRIAQRDGVLAGGIGEVALRDGEIRRCGGLATNGDGGVAAGNIGRADGDRGGGRSGVAVAISRAIGSGDEVFDAHRCAQGRPTASDLVVVANRDAAARDCIDIADGNGAGRCTRTGIGDRRIDGANASGAVDNAVNACCAGRDGKIACADRAIAAGAGRSADSNRAGADDRGRVADGDGAISLRLLSKANGNSAFAGSHRAVTNGG